MNGELIANKPRVGNCMSRAQFALSSVFLAILAASILFAWFVCLNGETTWIEWSPSWLGIIAAGLWCILLFYGRDLDTSVGRIALIVYLVVCIDVTWTCWLVFSAYSSIDNRLPTTTLAHEHLRGILRTSLTIPLIVAIAPLGRSFAIVAAAVRSLPKGLGGAIVLVTMLDVLAQLIIVRFIYVRQ
jgi:hypothetical protein